MNEPAIPKKIETLKTAILLPYVRNSRTHSEAQIQQIASSIKEFGFTNPILIDENNQIIAGHGRLAAAHLLKIKEVPCIRLSHLTEVQKKAYVIADNKLALNAGWDDDLLALELKDLESEDFDLSLTGFSEEELAKLLVEAVEGQTDPDDVPEVKETAITVLGDIWTLGKHRLMCGDSTSIDSVNSIIKNYKIDALITDPPYGISYKSPSGEGLTKRGNYKVIKGDDNDFDPNCLFGYSDLIVSWGANHYSDKLPSSACWLIWDKREGDAINNNSDCELAWCNKGGSARLFHHKWNGMIKASEKKNKRVHPTQKPIALSEWIFETIGAGQNILDLFGGSGSTLIACEKTNRNCFMMELDEKYCDVIIRRWQDFTGKKAIHSGTGKTFDEMSNERSNNSSS